MKISVNNWYFILLFKTIYLKPVGKKSRYCQMIGRAWVDRDFDALNTCEVETLKEAGNGSVEIFLKKCV